MFISNKINNKCQYVIKKFKNGKIKGIHHRHKISLASNYLITKNYNHNIIYVIFNYL